MTPPSRPKSAPPQWNARVSSLNGTQRIEAVVAGKPVPVGQVEIDFNQGQARIKNLHVAPEYRRHSIGSSLVQRAVQAARTRGISTVSLLAHPGPGGAPAPALTEMYRKLGFRQVEMTPQGPEMRLGQAVQPKMAPPPAARPMLRPAILQRHPAPMVYRPAIPWRGTVQPMAAGPSRTIQRADERYNTMYTHMLTRPTSQLTGTPQGPHTVAHGLVSFGISQVTAVDDWDGLDDLFNEQVPHPDDILELLQNELPAKALKDARVERYLEAYNTLYGNIYYALENPGDADYESTLAAIRKIMELHPYQTYAWKSKKKASHKSTKGKNEAGHLKKLRGGDTTALTGLIDTSRVRFKDSKAFYAFLRLRLSMVASEGEIDALLI